MWCVHNGKGETEKHHKGKQTYADYEEQQAYVLDILKINNNSNNGKKVTSMKKNWMIVADKFSGMKLSNFYDTKNGIIEPTCEQLEKWKQNGHRLKCVRWDNAGENTKLEKMANSEARKSNP